MTFEELRKMYQAAEAEMESARTQVRLAREAQGDAAKRLDAASTALEVARYSVWKAFVEWPGAA